MPRTVRRLWALVLGVLAPAVVGSTAMGGPPPQFVRHPLSAFDRRKAEALLQTRLPCLGCHELDGQGGQIGPRLDKLRVQPVDYIYNMIRDPLGTAPGTVMPRVPMDAATLDLIANYLLERATPAGEREPRFVADTRAADSTPAALYGHRCTPCHGARGGGDGPNARFLSVRPTAHADSTLMSARTDDELFDTIFAGGYVMNRSNRMPPFGETLTRAEIWSLVRYIRTLCRCEQPAWARGS